MGCPSAFTPNYPGEETQPMIRVRSRGFRSAIIWLGLCSAILGFAKTAKGDVISVTNLVTDEQAVNSAQITDPFLKNPWGLSHSAGSPFWVSDNGIGVATLYQVNPITNVTSKVILGMDPSGGVVIPPVGSGTPTGQVFNTNSGGAF